MLLYGSIAVFTLLAAGLVALNLTQGPRLTTAQMNVQTSVERAGQRLLLQANEVIAPVSDAQVSVSPAATVKTTTNQTSIQVEFGSVLAYNTTYTVTATGVRSASQNATSTFTYSFTTPDAVVSYLVPGSTTGVGAAGGAATDDRIVRASLTGETSDTVFSAPEIRRFTTIGSKLVVATPDTDGYDLLDIVSPDGSAAPIPVQLAGPGTVTGLASSVKSNLFGYTYRAAPSPFYPTSADQLYIYDTTLGQAYSIPVTGPDHELLDVKSWAFLPGTTSLVVQRPDGALFLVDALGLLDGSSAAVQVGAVDDMLGFLPNTKSLVTASGGSAATIDFAQPGTPVTAPFALAGAAVGAANGASTLLPEPLDSTGAVVAPGPGATSLQKVDGTGSETLFSAPAGTTIIRYCLSANGRYAVAEAADAATATATVPTTAVPTAAAPTIAATTTTYIPLDDPTASRTVTGSQPDWCSAG
ncbi:hypothetical protein B7R21_01320 [Subtercola boreus]|uniref:SbsA Ig-like domain-containing protein n=2 Tax=Subtercola boreus TaxID=120213 RepID=A0A3E0W4S2_9MICO|nr:hypothetical protein B7R21_01320 [Subtercola boreus]